MKTSLSQKYPQNMQEDWVQVHKVIKQGKLILMLKVFCHILIKFLPRHTSHGNTPITSFTKLFKIHKKKVSIVKSVPVNWQGMENIFATKTFLQRIFFFTFTVLLKVFLHRTSFIMLYTFWLK